MATAKLQVRSEAASRAGQRGLLAHLTNPADSPAAAFAIRIQVVDAKTGERILPIFAEQNYLTLMRGESRDVFVAFDAPDEIRNRATLVAIPFNLDSAVAAESTRSRSRLRGAGSATADSRFNDPH
jgi:hypothetical protein